MCTGLELAALGASGAGIGLGAIGQNKTIKSNARIQNDQTVASGREFDIRNQLANDIFAENTAINRQMYDELASLSDAEFAARTGLSKQAFNQLDQIERDRILRDFAAADAQTSAYTGARTGRDTEIDAARRDQYAGEDAARRDQYAGEDAARTGQYDVQDRARSDYVSTLARGNAEQDARRSRADAVVSDIMAIFAPEAAAATRTGAEVARNDLVARAVSPAGASAPAGRIDPALKAAFDRYSAAGRDTATRSASAASRVASYGDAADANDRGVTGANERTAFIRDEAERALTPLSAELKSIGLQYRNAGDLGDLRFKNANELGKSRYGAATAYGQGRRDNAVQTYTGRRSNADADLAAALGISETRAAGEARPVVSYTGAMDDALAGFYGGRGETASGRGNTIIGANEARLQGSNAVSQNYENGMAGITAFRMNNQPANMFSTLGQFASAVSPSLFSYATSRKPATTPATNARPS